MISVFCLTILSGLNVYISVLMQQIIDTIAVRDMARVIQVSVYSFTTFVLLIIVCLIQSRLARPLSAALLHNIKHTHLNVYCERVCDPYQLKILQNIFQC